MINQTLFKINKTTKSKMKTNIFYQITNSKKIQNINLLIKQWKIKIYNRNNLHNQNFN